MMSEKQQHITTVRVQINGCAIAQEPRTSYQFLDIIVAGNLDRAEHINYIIYM